MKASWKKYRLIFKRPAGTSRGVLNYKDTYFIIITDNAKTGIGECNLFKGLSADDQPDYEQKLNWLCHNIHLSDQEILSEIKDYSSLIFGWEQAKWSLQSQKNHILFPSKFTEGTDKIPINGLVWMGDKEFMLQQVKDKISQGFSVIKLKIGAIDFDEELSILKYIRQQFSARDIEIRLDANGAFSPSEAMEKLNKLATYHIHSIEQPIRQGQMEEMAALCKKTPIPIALDEELIGYNHLFDKTAFLKQIKPQYIILKPALHGGFTGTETWIKAAEQNQIKWWITSALESNVGLNAIAQYTYMLQPELPQGLGTGGLFTNNFDSPLYITEGSLAFDTRKVLSVNLK